MPLEPVVIPDVDVRVIQGYLAHNWPPLHMLDGTGGDLTAVRERDTMLR